MKKKFFDFCIGNPPYQESQKSNNKQTPIYQYFYDAAKKLSDRYMLISPARFLFNAGLTPKEWNKKMLSDVHLNVEMYEPDGAKIFPNTDIKGGVAVIYRDEDIDFGAIENFIPNPTLRSIAQKVKKISKTSISTIMHAGRSDLKFNDTFLNDFPCAKEDRLRAIQSKNPTVSSLGPGEEYEVKSSAFDVLTYAFTNQKPEDIASYYKILGLSKGKREYRWIKKEYMSIRNKTNNNINNYKVLLPKASGNGHFGETLTAPLVSYPNESSTPTFISIGNYETETEASNTVKYIKTKFARALLSILKITQDIIPSKWEYVPIQDFTDKSDINWTKSIQTIDQQLYKKYNLDKAEIDFIETKVKEMS